jgi:hypothetical protein
MRRRTMGWATGLAVAAWVVSVPGAAFADATINFDGFPAGTVELTIACVA